jgi:arginyl-tRNA synthetase
MFTQKVLITAVLVAVFSSFVNKVEGATNIDIVKNQIPVEKSTDKNKGDLTSTVVLRIAKKVGKNPIELSKLIV